MRRRVKADLVIIWAAAASGCVSNSFTGSKPASSASSAEALLYLYSAGTDVAPTVDGKMDSIWERARPLTVHVREAMGGGNSRSVVLRALHTSDTLYVLAQWTDRTCSDMRDPYIWEAAKSDYDRPTTPDDQFALEFPLDGDFDLNMLAHGKTFTADVWHWKAGRGNPVGWVDDKRHVISTQPTEGAQEYVFGTRGKVYIARPMDAGSPSYRQKPKPVGYVGAQVDSYEPQEPTGSLADIRGKGVHDGSGWTLEMSRKLDTGHADDARIDPSKDQPCAIALLDDELYWNHSVSTVLILRFEDR